MSHSTTLPSRFNRIMAIVLWAVSALAVVMTAFSGDETTTWVYPGAVATSWLAWTALWRPYLRVDDAGVFVQNVTHSVSIPWDALIHVDTKNALTLFTPGRQFGVWSAPAPGFLTAYAAGRTAANRERRASGAAPRHADLIGTESGDAAIVVREAWNRRREAGLITSGVADEVVVRRQWQPLPLFVGAALCALTVATLGVTG